MKYIRTKNGVYLPYQYYSDGQFYIVNQFLEQTPLSEIEIIKQADTIEELCDEFVFIDKNKLIEHRCWTHLEWAIMNCKRNNIDISTIYGAIWTDKGLIYVAKMNDKGELELI